MALSKPAMAAQVIARLTPEQKANLERMAAECDISLSFALREGARLYLEELAIAQSRAKDQMRMRVSA